MFLKLYTKIRSLIKRCSISEINNDDNFYCIAKITYLDKNSISELLFPYGMSANPPKDTLGIVFNILGKENNKITMVYATRDRFKQLKVGEVINGSPKFETYIKFNENKEIEIHADKIIFKDEKINFEKEMTIETSNDINIKAPKVNLGDGGNEIARKGDQVKVNVGGTDYFGTIISGGTNTSI